MFNDVMIIVQSQRRGIHRFVKRPRIGSVFLGEKVFEDAIAVFELLR